MAEHKDIPVGEIHSPFQWEVLTIPELAEIVPEGVNDVRKVAFVVDDGTGNPTAYVLTQFTPNVVWKPLVSVIGGGGSVVWGQITGTVDNQVDLKAYLEAKFYTQTQINSFMDSYYNKTEVDVIASAKEPANANIQSHISSTSNPHGTTAAQVGAYTIAQTNTFLNGKADLVGGVVPASQLPSFVDDVLEYANLAALPVTGEAGKIYITLDTNRQYRWSGSSYIDITGSAATAIGDLSDVENLNPVHGNILRYDSATAQYKNVPLPASVSAKTIQTTTANTVSSDNVTMINLPELTVTLEANSTYEIEGFLPLQQSNTNGYALQFVAPSDCQPFYEISPAINAGTSATQGHLYSATAGTVITTTGSVSAANTTMVPHVKAIIKTVSAGTLVFNFRYNNSAAGTTTILAGATIVWEKIQ